MTRHLAQGHGSFNLATVVWFGCAIEDARDDAEKAIRDLAVEMGSISVEPALIIGAVFKLKPKE